jgi:hypothetical protein
VRSLIAITICDDLRLHLTRDEVQEVTCSWLDIPCCDVGVEFYPLNGFLLLLPSLELRDRVLAANGGLTVGRVKL